MDGRWKKSRRSEGGAGLYMQWELARAQFRLCSGVKSCRATARSDEVVGLGEGGCAKAGGGRGRGGESESESESNSKHAGRSGPSGLADIRGDHEWEIRRIVRRR